jgi:aldehyde dehydrogenase (NAD+)
VLVNEFIKKDFLEQVLQQSIRYLSGSSDVVANNSSKSSQKTTPSISESFKVLLNSKSWRLNAITQGDHGAILELLNLSALPQKIIQPLLCISAITSLEHAISLVDQDLEPSQTLTAAYHFGAPAAGKYLSQFINADATFVNHIPYRLLLGPTAPSFQNFDIEKRYNTYHFTRASPAYISLSSSQGAIAKIVASKDGRKAAADLLSKSSQEIKEKKRAESIAIGYFEQGILIGLGTYGIPLLTCIGATIFFGVRAGLRRWVFV